MKYLIVKSFSITLSSLVLLTMITGCGTTDTSGQIRYSGAEVTYNRDHTPIGSYVNKVYTYNEYASTFTLADGGRVFTFTGSHPIREGENVGHYTGTYLDGLDSGTVFVGFDMGIHVYYHLVNDTSTYTAFDGKLN